MGRCAAAFAFLLLVWSGSAYADSFEEGLRAFRSGQADVARDIWLTLAEAGDVAAQYSLGKLYEQGEAPVPQDLAEAVRWYREAAAQRLPAAQNNLALMYAKGRGVPLDPLRAVELWTAAADQSYRWAQYNLGLAYFRGQGVPKDEREAAAWFRKAADGELAQAQFIMGQLKREGLTLQQDSGVALAWYRRAADNGDLRAEREVKALEAAGIEPKQPGPPEIEPRRLVAGGAQAVGDEAKDSKAPMPLFKFDPGQASAAEGKAEKAAPADPPEREVAVQSRPEALPAVAKKDPVPAKRKPAAPASEPPAKARPEAKAVEPAKPKAAAPQKAQAAAETKPAAPGKKAEAAPAEAGKPPKPAKVQKAALPAAPAEPKKNGRFRVWLASADSNAKAASLWEQTRERHPEVFSDTGADFSRVDLGGGKALVRILVGPLDSQGAAKALCQRLRAAEPGAFCKVQAQK